MSARKKIAPPDNLRRLYWIVGSIFVLIIILIFLVISDYGLYQLYLLHREKVRIEQHITELKAEQDSLRSQRVLLESNLQYIEKLAREKYRMARRGEKVFRVIERPNS